MQLRMPLGHPLLGLGGSTLSLQLDVVVVAGVGSGHVEAVPATPISSLVRCIAAFSPSNITYQKTLAMAKPDPMMLISPLFPSTNQLPELSASLKYPPPSILRYDKPGRVQFGRLRKSGNIPRAMLRSRTRFRRSIYNKVSPRKALPRFLWPGRGGARPSH